MATVEELVKQYETDEKLQKEVEAILADGKITFMEFVTFAGVSILILPAFHIPGLSGCRSADTGCLTHWTDHSITSPLDLQTF